MGKTCFRGDRSVRRIITFLLLCTALWAQEPNVKSEVLTEGYGRGAKLGDQVAISYTLRLANGSVVDSTPDGQNFSVTLGDGKVVPGLEQALVGMRRGEKRDLEIPPELGYGSSQTGPIPGNSTLFFTVELKAISESRHDDHDHGHDDHSHGEDDHDHSHDEGNEHRHSSELKNTLGREGFETRPDAHNLDRPAMFEYMIRDFYTRPWRYDDTKDAVWKANGVLTLLAIAVSLLTAWLERRRRGTA